MHPLNVGLILLAAGNSSRMGDTKQLLPFAGTTLLQHAVQAALGSECSSIVVVLGANADALLPQLTASPVHPSVHADWPAGIGSSLRAGLRHLLALRPDLDACLITLCDQPRVDADLLRTLVLAHTETHKPLVACHYNNSPGVPALFARCYFPALAALPDTSGAKSILTSHPTDLHLVPTALPALDIDTPADYATLVGRAAGPAHT